MRTALRRVVAPKRTSSRAVWRDFTVPTLVIESPRALAPLNFSCYSSRLSQVCYHYQLHRSCGINLRGLRSGSSTADVADLNTPHALSDEAADEEFVPVVPRRTLAERAAFLRGVDELLKSVKESFDSPQPLPNFFLIRAWVKRRKRMTSAYRLYRFVQLQTNRDDIYDFMGFTERSAYQWFILSTLHVWMVSCRLKLEHEAFDFYMELAEFFWQDVEDVLQFLDVSIFCQLSLISFMV
jgi:hypothetical protein